jgi:hypothetical protein
MQEEEKLSIVLGLLDNYWSRFTSDLSDKQMGLLKDQLSGLANKVEYAEKPEDIYEASQNFFSTIATFEPLKFLANLDEQKSRGGSLPEPSEDMKIKIINYCVMLKGKCDENIETTFNG